MSAMAVQLLEAADRRGRIFMEDSDSEAESEGSYAQIDDGASNRSDSSSIHSAGEELADYWDPYCKLAPLTAVAAAATITYS